MRVGDVYIDLKRSMAKNVSQICWINEWIKADGTPSPVVLSQGWFTPQWILGNVWRQLWLFGLWGKQMCVRVWVWVYACVCMCVTIIWWVEARDAVNILQCTGQPIPQRVTWSKMSGVLRLRNSAVCSPQYHMHSNVWKMAIGLWKIHLANVCWTFFMLKFNEGIHSEIPLKFSFSLSYLPFAPFPYPSPLFNIHGKNEAILQKGMSEVKSLALSSY